MSYISSLIKDSLSLKKASSAFIKKAIISFFLFLFINPIGSLLISAILYSIFIIYKY